MSATVHLPEEPEVSAPLDKHDDEASEAEGTEVAGESAAMPVAKQAGDLVAIGAADEMEPPTLEVESEYGPVKVTVKGDPTTQPVMLTFHDMGLNHDTCFKRFFNMAPQAEPVIGQFCVVHVDCPGQRPDDNVLEGIAYFEMDVLAEILATVVDKLRLNHFVGFAAGAGANAMLRYTIKHPNKVTALILLGPTSRKAGWIEWGTKWMALTNLWYRSVQSYWEDFFLERWFSEETKESNPDLCDYHAAELRRIPPANLLLYVQGFQRRAAIPREQLRTIQCPVLVFLGDATMLEDDGVVLLDGLPDDTHCQWIRLRETGMLLTEESPMELLEPIRLHLNGAGYYEGHKAEPAVSS